MTGPSRPTLPGEPLADFPLRGSPAIEAVAHPVVPNEAAATLAPRARALAADSAAVLLGVAACLLAAVAVRGRGPRLEGLAWAGAFGLLLSFFATVASLVMFGRTVGMALAGLAAGGAGGAGEARNLSPAEAWRRWVGTAATAASLGLPLIWTARDAVRPTPADRLSGRPLRAEDADLS